MKQLPNILTLGNLFFGTLAILFTLHTPAFISEFNGQDFIVTTPPPIYWASVMIGIAAVFDFLDGLVARMLKAQSALGVQLDSLSDLVSFGVAPGLILYQLLSRALMQQPGAMEVSLMALTPALILPCFAAYRLARFNVSPGPSSYFQGLPTPAVGLFVAALPLILFYGESPVSLWLGQVWILYMIILIPAVLMVTNVPFFSLKIKNFSWRSNRWRYLQIGLTLMAIPLLKWTTVAFSFALYLILSLGKYWFAPELNEK